MNTGKQFEADFKASVPKDAWCYRLKDSAATYYGGNENLSFSIDNICDFLVYRYPMNHLFELKTIERPLSLWKRCSASTTRQSANTARKSTSRTWWMQWGTAVRPPM